MAKNKEKKLPDDEEQIPTVTDAADAEAVDAGEAEVCDEAADIASAAAAAALEAEKERYVRLYAEYENFRKRSTREREALYTDIRSETVLKLLPVYDNLERALAMECTDEAFYKGVEMTMTQLKEIFEGMGIAVIPTVGEAFDPDRHNAVMHIEDPEQGENIIVEEFQKGFMLGDKVIRFSVVKVAN